MTLEQTRMQFVLALNSNAYLNMCESSDMINALHAIDKQIPRKVKYLNRHGSGTDYYNRDYYNCPSCGRRLRNKQKDPHCGRCGQALDWREDNDR